MKIMGFLSREMVVSFVSREQPVQSRVKGNYLKHLSSPEMELICLFYKAHKIPTKFLEIPYSLQCICLKGRSRAPRLSALNNCVLSASVADKTHNVRCIVTVPHFSDLFCVPRSAFFRGQPCLCQQE